MKTNALCRAIFGTFVLFQTYAVNAALPEPPQVSSVDLQAAPKVTAPIAQVEVLAGTPTLISQNSKKTHTLAYGTKLASGDTLVTPAGARVRVVLASGDALHIGQESVVGLLNQGNKTTIQVWQGDVSLYRLPISKAQILAITPQGQASIESGKMGLSVHDKTTQVSAFNNWIRWNLAAQTGEKFTLESASMDWQMNAQWTPDNGTSLNMGAGTQVEQSEGAQKTLALKPSDEEDFTILTSPEGLAAAEGVLAWQETRVADAKRILTEVQTAFPSNAQAAYYLGALALQQGNTLEAIKQWQNFSRLSPAEAEEKGVIQHLTLLIGEELQGEIARALENEQKLSKEAPEPGSVAVMPFASKATDAKQQTLSRGLTAMVISDLSRVPGLKVLERAKLQKIAEEIRLQSSGLTDDSSSVRVGKLMKAEKVILGDYRAGEASTLPSAQAAKTE